MSDGTISWRTLWAETTGAVGDRPAARWLCEMASGVDGAEFIDALDEPATDGMVHHLDSMVERVRAGEPLQYVLGRWGFRHLDLMVDRRVLIPRPETEQVVDVALRLAASMSRPLLVADLGTGSGAIGLALATELPLEGVEVWITDASADALDVARANLTGIGRAAINVCVAQGSWCAALPAERRGDFDLVVANPPYVADDDPDLDPIVREWEPPRALFAGSDGLADIRTIIDEARHWLRPGGWLVLEIGSTQAASVTQLLQRAGYVDMAVTVDLAGQARIAHASVGP